MVDLDIYTKKRLIRNMKSMERFSEKMRRSIIKLLAKNKSVIEFRYNKEIGSWEEGRMDYYMWIFPMINITYDKNIVIIMRK